ncbi:MAG: hypothetical protein AB8I69_11095 [Anaerolineae bacterium]
MTRQDQYQLCVHWPDRGLAKEAIRLASIEMDEWNALRPLVRDVPRGLRLLSEILAGDPPYYIEHAALASIAEECDDAIDYKDTASPAQSALQTLSMFFSQALEQQEAGVVMDIWPGKRFETQVYVEPGTDLLADLAEINELEKS